MRMKRSLPKLFAGLLLVAFVAMGVAMVLPHHHDAATVQHACWVCQAKAVGAAVPSLYTEVDPQFTLTSSLPGEETVLFAWAVPLAQAARAPPLAFL